MTDGEALPAAAEPGYLTEVLRRGGVLDTARVDKVAIASSRTTILSRIAWLSLSYDGPATGAPRSLVLKTGLPERVGPDRLGGRQEVAFYTDLAAMKPTALVPCCFDAQWDAETGSWHLLLEDLAETHFVSDGWPLPPTLAENRKIVAARARLHAAWWDDPRLGVSVGSWADPADPQLAEFARTLAQFEDRIGEHLSPERRDFYRRLIDSGRRLNARYHTHRDMTIVHGDSHVWNALLPNDADGDDVRLFDWDCWRVDVATDDLAYMMALQWYPEQRCRHERALLDHYYEVLQAEGVGGYDRRALDDDYRLSVLWQTTAPVWQAMNNIPGWVWVPSLERIFMAVDDLGCRELLG
jgi:hypothetical protein